MVNYKGKIVQDIISSEDGKTLVIVFTTNNHGEQDHVAFTIDGGIIIEDTGYSASDFDITDLVNAGLMTTKDLISEIKALRQTLEGHK